MHNSNLDINDPSTNRPQIPIRCTRHHLYRVLGLFKLNNRFEHLVVAARKRRKVHHGRMPSVRRRGLM
jgi:hypothetical protein